ncbi:IS3 family transposase [Salinicoccus albus]
MHSVQYQLKISSHYIKFYNRCRHQSKFKGLTPLDFRALAA